MFSTYIDRLKEAAPRAAERAAEEIISAAERLADDPDPGRPSRWSGLRERSLFRWRKILVYQMEQDRVLVVALYDARQDLAKVDPGGAA